MQIAKCKLQNERNTMFLPGHFAICNLQFAFCIVCFLYAAPLLACDTPVYRYALESWPADNYRAAVVHRGSLSVETQRLVDHLTERAGSANLSVKVIDLDRPQDEVPEQFQNIDVSAGPRLILNYPMATRIDADAWAGPLTREAVDTLLDSPLRRQVVAHLQAGETVWLLMESGTKAADETAAKVVEENRTASPPSAVLRVRRGDPAEAVLVRQLLGSEPDLAGWNDPMAFPVFGRGRVLYALVGAGITAENVRKATEFLDGDCSCTVKRDNPGTDLLLTAAWGEIKPAVFRGDRESVVIGSGIDDKAAPVPEGERSRAALWVAVGFAAGLVLLTGALVLRSHKRPPVEKRGDTHGDAKGGESCGHNH